VRDAYRKDGAHPTTVGYGYTSDPISGLTYDSLFVALDLAIKEPWRVLDVDQAGCSVEGCNGYILRKTRFRKSGENVFERITISEETGSATFGICDAGGRLGDVERVLTIHTPLRLEMYERSTSSGLRLDWKASYSTAHEVFANLVKLAKELKSPRDVVGYGIASKPITGMDQDTLWRAMLYSMRNPAECGLKVDEVCVRDMKGYMHRTMRLHKVSGSPTVADNIRVIESAREITYRPVIKGVESEEERVFALRTDPLRIEMFNRNSKDEMRLDWQAPRSVCFGLFQTTAEAAKCM